MLYRYQFDPNTAIRVQMTNIWKVLVAEPVKTIDKYFPEIIKDLLANITTSQWRVREGCCGALADVLRGRGWTQISPYISQIWILSFRALDDVKESVRSSALTACKRLGKLSIHLCKTSESRVEGTGPIDILLPCLIEHGLLSNVEDIRALSLGVLLELIKEAGIALRPHAVTLTMLLLEGLSGLESPMINYFSARLTNDNHQDQLDAMRVAASRDSPLSAAITKLVPFLDATVLPDLIPKLIDMMKRGLGPATKSGTAPLHLYFFSIFFFHRI